MFEKKKIDLKGRKFSALTAEDVYVPILPDSEIPRFNCSPKNPAKWEAHLDTVRRSYVLSRGRAKELQHLRRLTDKALTRHGEVVLRLDEVSVDSFFKIHYFGIYDYLSGGELEMGFTIEPEGTVGETRLGIEGYKALPWEDIVGGNVSDLGGMDSCFTRRKREAADLGRRVREMIEAGNTVELSFEGAHYSQTTGLLWRIAACYLGRDDVSVRFHMKK